MLLDQQIEHLREGLEFAAFAGLAERLELPQSELAKIVSISDSTLLRRRREGRLNKTESNRLYRLQRVVDLAEDTLGAERVVRWFNRHAPSLGGVKPLELADTEAGLEAIQTLLLQIEYGVYV